MQIHELNNYNGALDSGAFLPVDNGDDTGKISAPSFLAPANEAIQQLGLDLNGRIDNIIAGGDAPSAAEIVDARRGGNGINYASLGASIRGQYDSLLNDIFSQLVIPLLRTRGQGLEVSIQNSALVQSSNPVSFWGVCIFTGLTRIKCNYNAFNQYIVLACDPPENGNVFYALALCLVSGQHYGKLVLFDKDTYVFDPSPIPDMPAFDLSQTEVINNGSGSFTVTDGSNSIDINISGRSDVSTYQMSYCIGAMATKYYAVGSVLQTIIDTDLPGETSVRNWLTPLNRGVYVSPENEASFIRTPSYTVITGSYYSYASNSIVETEGWSYIDLPINDEEHISFYAKVFSNSVVNPLSFIDKDGNLLSNGYSGASGSYAQVDSSVPDGAVKAYISFAEGTLQSFNVLAKSLNSVIELINSSSDSSSFINGKTINCLGDSITAQNQYTNALTNNYGAIINNYGISGSSISNKTGNAFYGRVAAMSDNCDCIFVLGGTNDWGYSAILGTKDDTTAATFCGGLYLLCEALRSKYPTKPIFIGTIFQRDWQDTATDPVQHSGIDENANGDTIQDFNDAIKYFAHRYDLIVIDGYSKSGIIVANVNVYLADRLHPNAVGGARIAGMIANDIGQYKYLFV